MPGTKKEMAIGWDAIAAVLGMPVATAMKRKQRDPALAKLIQRTKGRRHVKASVKALRRYVEEWL